MSGLMADLATILTSLRTKVNTNSLIGNLIHVANNVDDVEVGGLVDSPAVKGGPWESHLDYYRAILEDQISIMETDPRYQQNRPLVGCSMLLSPVYLFPTSKRLTDLSPQKSKRSYQIRFPTFPFLPILKSPPAS